MSQTVWKSDALFVPFFAIHKVYIRCMLTIRNVYKKSLYKNAKVNNFYHHCFCFIFTIKLYMEQEQKSKLVTPSTPFMKVDKFETKGDKRRMVLNT